MGRGQPSAMQSPLSQSFPGAMGRWAGGAWSRENSHITEAKGTLACHLVRIHLEPLIAIFMLEQKREGGNHFYRGGSYYWEKAWAVEIWRLEGGLATLPIPLNWEHSAGSRGNPDFVALRLLISKFIPLFLSPENMACVWALAHGKWTFWESHLWKIEYWLSCSPGSQFGSDQNNGGLISPLGCWR